MLVSCLKASLADDSSTKMSDAADVLNERLNALDESDDPAVPEERPRPEGDKDEDSPEGIETAQDSEDNDDDDDECTSESLMVVETQEGLTVLDTAENLSYYFVGENEAMESSLPGEDSPTDQGIATDTSISDELLLNFERLKRAPSTELPDTVTKLDTPEGSRVYLVGTAHFSKESQQDVVKTIEAVQPDAVVVELCKSRVDILKYDEEFLLKEAKNIDFQKLKLAVKQSGVVGGVMQVLLLSMSAHITEQLGMAPGGEFRTAFHEARKIPGCQLFLGDRPIQVTLSRAMAALSIWQKMKLAWHLITNKEAISPEDVERCKKKDLLAEMLAEMTGDFPTLYKVFVSERDEYLAWSLRRIAAPLEVPGPDGETHGYLPRVVVGVIGIGHASGVADNWDKDIDVDQLLRLPPASRSSHLLKFSLKAFVGVVLAWGCYRLAKWTHVGSLIPFYQ